MDADPRLYCIDRVRPPGPIARIVQKISASSAKWRVGTIMPTWHRCTSSFFGSRQEYSSANVAAFEEVVVRDLAVITSYTEHTHTRVRSAGQQHSSLPAPLRLYKL